MSNLINTTNRGANTVNEIFKVIGDLGFPVAAALAGGFFSRIHSIRSETWH